VNGDFRVGHWLVAPSLNSISSKGTTVRLEPKVMEVLLCLAKHAGETLPKETLFHAVWPDTFVTDDVLTHSISELRRAFEDDAREPRIIQTIPKRGYRLIAPVSAACIAASPAAGAARDSIAVLPFVSMSAEPDDEFFTDGITEEIINALTQIPQLHVVARSSAFSFKGKYVDARLVGEQLSVRTVLEGSVRRAGNRLRITAQLINAADGFHLWSECYDREMRDVFAIQDEIARAIVERLKVTLEGSGLVKAGTNNLEAYQLYVKGRALLYRRGGAIPRAVECFERAVALDSDYALAWAGLADSNTGLGYYGLVHPQVCMPKGMEAARRAVALDSSLAEGHSALAMACLMGGWDKAEAEQEFLRALELNPRYIQARDWYAFFYLQFAAGRLEEGVAQAKLAVESDPLSSYARTVLGFTYTFAGKYDCGVQECERGVELDSESYFARGCLLVALHLSGRFDEAVTVGEQALAMSGRHSWSMAGLAVTFADWGKSVDAEAIYAEMTARARRYYVQPCTLALAAAAAGFEDEAIRHASEAFGIRDPMSQMFFSRVWPDSGRLRMYPRFLEIAADTGWLLK
jgi:adenylate cyclase